MSHQSQEQHRNRHSRAADSESREHDSGIQVSNLDVSDSSVHPIAGSSDGPITPRWKGYQLLLLARLKEMYREPEVIFWVFIFPILLALGLGVAFRNKPADISRVVVVEGSETARVMDLLHQAV